MNYTMTEPCADCPFRTDCPPGWLGEERAVEIVESITAQDASFPCHKTTEHDDDGDVVSEGQHCAGALILLERDDNPNQMMRIAERLGMYDRRKLNMDAPVFDELEDFVEHHA